MHPNPPPLQKKSLSQDLKKKKIYQRAQIGIALRLSFFRVYGGTSDWNTHHHLICHPSCWQSCDHAFHIMSPPCPLPIMTQLFLSAWTNLAKHPDSGQTYFRLLDEPQCLRHWGS